MSFSFEETRKRLLVTGSNGFVAGSVIAQARGDWEVHGIGRREPPDEPRDVHFHQADLLEKKEVNELFVEIRPEAVIHSAAIADIDFCQNNRELAYRSNVEVTEFLGNLCEEYGSSFVFCSTDNVFDGKRGFYSEKDTPNPVNFYGETKVHAEELVRSSKTRGVVARIALVIGLPVIGRGNSFLSGAIERWKSRRSGEYPENEIRTPIDIITVGKALIELAREDHDGIFHLAGNSRLNRFEMAREIAEHLGYDLDLIQSVNSNEVSERAARPDDASLENSKTRSLLETPMLSLVEGLDLTMEFRAQ